MRLVTIPPTTGVAIGFITSLPVPVLHMIGSRPKRVVATVMSSGRTLSTPPSEIAAAEPYFIGSHSGASGAWVSGPEDLQSDESKSEYFWGYANMTTVKGLFAAGDASGA